MGSVSRIHIGTSGWHYPHWRGPFYPDDLPESRWLEFYSEKFRAVEINSSFYRLPSRKTLEAWCRSVPSGFVFSVKASRYITHMKKLKDCRRPLLEFYQRVDVLGEKGGPILFQLPPRWRVHPERLENFLRLLSRQYRHAFEFRDPSWFDPRVYELLRGGNAAFCAYELAGRVAPRAITADFVYVRLHGPEGAYRGQYEERTLAGWAQEFLRWADRGKEVFCFFDNDQAGYAAQDAGRIQSMLGPGASPPR